MLLLLSLAVPPRAPAQVEPLEGEWIRFSLSGRELCGASSVLESEYPWRESRYDPRKAQDGDPATSWVEGAAGEGTGEVYLFSHEALPEALGFVNGYAKNPGLFEKNYRVRELELQVYAVLTVDGFSTELVSFYDGKPIGESLSIFLEDSMERQRIDLPFDRPELRAEMEEFRSSEELATWSFPMAREMGLSGDEGLRISFRYLIELEIRDTYEGSKWEDTCIAEIWPDFGSVHAVAVAENSKSLFIRSAACEQIPSYRSRDRVLSIIETSPDKEWVLLITEPAYLEPGERAETGYIVIHAPTGRDMTSELFAEPQRLGLGIIPTGFLEEGGRCYLLYEDLEEGRSERAPCPRY